LFAKNLEYFLTDHLRGSDVAPDDYAEVAKRFDSLRGCRCIPPGRDNRAKHLSHAEIAAALLGLVPVRPGWAGHAATILRDLRPVGGEAASCWSANNFTNVIETVLATAEARTSLSHIAISVAEAGTNVHGLASVTYRCDGALRTVWFVSKFALTLTKPGAEVTFDSKTLEADIAHSLSFNARFFERLARAIKSSLIAPAEPAGDGSEYDAAEDEQVRLKALGVTNRSNFLHVGIGTQVTWPKEEMLVKFDKYQLVLMPKTGKHTQSVHLDLTANRLTSDEAMTVINRFLSTLAWCDDQFAIVEGGWSGNPVPVAVRKRDLAFATVHHWCFSRTILGEEKARRALALYREGLNANEASLSSYAVLSFYKVIELGYRETERVKKWVRRTFLVVVQEVRADDARMNAFLKDCGTALPEDYIWDACRLAVAHASVKSPSDADDATEIRRLNTASYVLQLLARRFISEHYKISDSPFFDDAEMP
jgi:hypothetical protein